MKRILALASICVPIALIATPLTSQAHDHRHHHHHKREHKEEYWDGQCKVERKWKSNGEYKEKRKCRDRPVVYQQPVYVEPQPVVVAPRPVIAVPRPEAIVISPQIVIRP